MPPAASIARKHYFSALFFSIVLAQTFFAAASRQRTSRCAQRFSAHLPLPRTGRLTYHRQQTTEEPSMSSNPWADFPPMSDDDLDTQLPASNPCRKSWPTGCCPLLLECKRARAAAPAPANGDSDLEATAADLTQVVLDTAEMAAHAVEVGYMGASTCQCHRARTFR